MRWQFERTTFAIALLSVAALIGVAVLTVQASWSFGVATSWVVHTQSVLTRIEEVLSGVTDAETSVRGFIVTGDEQFLAPYEPGLARLDEALAELAVLTAHNPTQKKRLEYAQPIIAARLNEIRQHMEMRRHTGIDEVAESLRRGGRQKMVEIRRTLAEMKREEQQHLRERLDAAEAWGRGAVFLLGCGLLLSLVFLSAAMVFWRRDLKARRAAEQAQRYSENIVDTLNEPLVIIGADLRVRSANTSFYKGFHATPESTVGRAFAEIGDGQWGDPSLISALKNMIAGNAELAGVEVTKNVPGQGARTLLVNARCLLGGDREKALFLVAMEDITERKTGLEALQKSQQMFQKLFESSPDGIILVNSGGMLMRANAQAGVLFGYRTEEMPGLELQQLLPERYRGRHAQHFNRYFQAPVTRAMGVGLELYAQRSDGSEFPVDIMLSPVETQLGALTLAVVRDISERKRAEQIHLQFRALFESLPGLYVVLKNDLTIVGVSDAYLAATMTTREAILGKRLFEAVPENPESSAEGAERIRASLRHVLESRAPDSLAVLRYDIRRPDGTYEERYWSPVNSPVLGADGSVEYLIHRVEDVTEFVRRKQRGATGGEGTAELQRRMGQIEAEIFMRAHEIEQVNERLREANDELESFSYSISHDLRAPLRHIDGFADMLKLHAEAQLDDKGRHYLTTIAEAAKKMGKLIDDLLAFSRTGRSEMNRRPVKLDSLVAEVRQMFEAETAKQGITWQVGPLPEVHGDAGMLRQVFVNLLSNAVKYTRRTPNPIIEVRSWAEDADKATVVVRDNGAGFEMKYVDKLFNVFQRLHTPREFEGTGVGLAIVRRVVQRHGGHVWAESEVNKGASFFVTLPTAAAKAARL